MNPHREALLLARKKIDAGEERFICHALDAVGQWHASLERAADALQAYIDQELGKAYTLTEWLNDQDVWPPVHQMHMARLAWIDRMLEDYP